MSTQDLHTSGHLVNTLQLPDVNKILNTNIFKYANQAYLYDNLFIFSFKDESPADFPRTVGFLDPNCILVMTNNG